MSATRQQQKLDRLAAVRASFSKYQQDTGVALSLKERMVYQAAFIAGTQAKPRPSGPPRLELVRSEP